MPYKSISELPPRVKNNLSEHKQEIFKNTFNNAWKEYGRKGEKKESKEQTAFKVAWNAANK